MKSSMVIAIAACSSLLLFSQALAPREASSADSCAAPAYTSSDDGYCGNHVCDQCLGGSQFSPCVPLPNPETSCNCPQDCSAPGVISQPVAPTPITPSIGNRAARGGSPVGEGGGKGSGQVISRNGINYMPMRHWCGPIKFSEFQPLSPRSGGYTKYYHFTIPKGVYRYASAAYQQSPSYAFNELMIVKWNGYITQEEYRRIVATQSGQPASPPYYHAGRFLDLTGTTVNIFEISNRAQTGGMTPYLLPDNSMIVDKQNGLITLTKDAFFTAVVEVGPVASRFDTFPVGDGVRYCTYTPPGSKPASYGGKSTQLQGQR